MNKMKTLTRSSQTSAQPCPCGCADCPDDACKLACLERPNFFFGQTLRDDDLTKLVEYTRDRLALERFRDGWGVVCGLYVDIHPDEAGVVTVNPGYAIDCCGNDVVLCDPMTIDLTSVLPEIADCSQPAGNGDDDDSAVSTYELLRAMGASSASTAGQKNWSVIDIYLDYGEQKADPRTTLARGNCRDAASCEYSRVIEKARLRPVLIDLATVSDPSEKWLEELRQHIRKVENLIGRVNSMVNGKTPFGDVIAMIKRWLHDYP
ncbi:MAG: hypothetical protein KC519_10840, partial [Anaerolineae bacterium]|nr:hypothetical protein [Anaerolineae bacterium]